jgi:hypothetical protein
MRRLNGLSPREAAVHRTEMLAAIGRRLRETYDVTQPLPDPLADLVRKIEHLEGNLTPGARTEPRASLHRTGGSTGSKPSKT